MAHLLRSPLTSKIITTNILTVKTKGAEVSFTVFVSSLRSSAGAHFFEDILNAGGLCYFAERSKFMSFDIIS